MTSISRQITAALRELGSGSGAFFLVDGACLFLDFSSEPFENTALSPDIQAAIVVAVSAGALSLQDLPADQQAAWRTAAPWGNFFYPIFTQGQVPWLAALVLAEAAFRPSEELQTVLLQWSQFAYLRRLLQAGARAEDERREALTGFLHHDLLQRGLFLKQRLMDSDVDLQAEINMLDESLDLIQQEVEAQRPVMINQGILFALQKLAVEIRAQGFDITWESGFPAREHPFTDRWIASGIYFIAASLIDEARKSVPSGLIELRLERPSRTGRSLRLAVSHDEPPVPGYSTTLAGIFERADMIGAQFDVGRDSRGRLLFQFEV